MRAPRRLVVVLVGLAVLVVTVVVVVRVGSSSSRCTPEPRVAAADVPPVFSLRDDDARLARLERAAGRWGLGRVVGAVGFDYGRWLSLTGLPGGIGAWTKDDAVFSVLADSLSPRWGIRQRTGRHAFDFDAETFWQLRLSDHAGPAIEAYDVDDGRPRWCVTTGTATSDTDPLGTAALPDGDLVAMVDGPGVSADLSRRRPADGRADWHRRVAGIDRGDFLGALAPGLLVAGGRPSYELTEPSVPAPAGPALTAVDAATGAVRWRRADGARLHVFGTSGGRLVVEESTGSGLRLSALDAAGRTAWSRPAPAGVGVDGALRGDVLVLRTGKRLVGLGARDGRQLWQRPLPRQHDQVLPYGFELDQQPMLDADHLLLGTTDALLAVDVRTGKSRRYPLPRAGISTTFWPYQLVVTGRLLAVVTNTGAVVLRRP